MPPRTRAKTTAAAAESDPEMTLSTTSTASPVITAATSISWNEAIHPGDITPTIKSIVQVLPWWFQLLLCVVGTKFAVEMRRGACEDTTPFFGPVKTIFKQTVWHTNCANAVLYENYAWTFSGVLVVSLLYRLFVGYVKKL